MEGDAKITKAYGIEYDDHIIHTVGPFFQNNGEDEEVLASCYTKVLDLAAETASRQAKRLRWLSFPSWNGLKLTRMW